MENIKSFEEFINEGNNRDWQQAANYKYGNDNAKQYLKERLDEIDNIITSINTSGASNLNN
jgi:hypothetical protein